MQKSTQLRDLLEDTKNDSSIVLESFEDSPYFLLNTNNTYISDQSEQEDGEYETYDNLKQPQFTKSQFEYDSSEEPELIVSSKSIKHLLKGIKSDKTSTESTENDEKIDIEKDNEDSNYIGVPISATPMMRKFVSASKRRQTEQNNRRNNKRTKPRDIPWLSALRKTNKKRKFPRNPLLFLHEEIVAFYDFIKSKDDEIEKRNNVITKATELVKELFPESIISVFGSVSTGTCLPLSDIDLSVANCPSSAIYKVSKALQYRGLTSEMELIEGAKIPIIKFVFKDTAITCDISFQQDSKSSVHADRIQVSNLAQKLIVVIKYFFFQREINDTFMGGFGSHFVSLSVLSLIQHSRAKLIETYSTPNLIEQQKRYRDYSNSNKKDSIVNAKNALDLGSLLLAYFDMFSNSFNSHVVGIDVRDCGSYYKKKENNIRPKGSKRFEGALMMLHPENQSIDVGAPCRYRKFRGMFQDEYRKLNSALQEYYSSGYKKDKNNNISILESIIKVDQILKDRYNRYY